MNESDLYRYVNHELTDRQQEEVEKWMNASAENQRIVENYRELFLATISLQLLQQAGPQKALKEVNKRIRRQQIRKLSLVLQRAAVIMWLPMLCFLAYQWGESRNREVITYTEIRMTPGMIGSTILPDGTKVWLNSSSYLKYATTFSGETREVTLDGEAYFDVTEDSDKPFIVHSGNSYVKVLGTQFNIDAYSNSNFIATTLVEGSVEFHYIDDTNVHRSVKIEPDKQVYFHKRSKKPEILEIQATKEIAWKDGTVELKETPLSEILWTLSKRFNAEFTVRNPEFYQYTFTGVFSNQQIERVLEHFKRSSDIHYKINYHSYPNQPGAKTQVELY